MVKQTKHSKLFIIVNNRQSFLSTPYFKHKGKLPQEQTYWQIMDFCTSYFESQEADSLFSV